MVRLEEAIFESILAMKRRCRFDHHLFCFCILARKIDEGVVI